MKENIKPATGRLGVLVVGVGGAVSTTMITGTLAARKELAKPIGSITQMATIRMENNDEKLIKDVVPLADLNDIVFGGCGGGTGIGNGFFYSENKKRAENFDFSYPFP